MQTHTALRIAGLARDVAGEERRLFAGFFRGWRLVMLAGAGVGVLAFLYSSQSFIFAHPDFLILVLAPPLLTWNAWARLRRHAHSGAGNPGAHPVDPSPAQLAILSFTLKLCALLLLIFKFIPQVFIAPYAFIEMSFWAQVALVLLLQGAFFAVMRRLTWLHPRPYLFFALMYFPAAGLYLAVENFLAPFIALVNVGLLLLTLGGVALGRRTGGA